MLRVGDEYPSVRINGELGCTASELAFPTSRRRDGCDVGTVRREPLNTIVSYQHVSGWLDRDRDGSKDLSGARPTRAPLGEECASGAEDVHSAIAPVSDVEISGSIGHHAIRAAELTVPRADASPLGEKGAGRSKFLDPGVGRVDRPVGPHSDRAKRCGKLPRIRTEGAPLGEKGAVIVKLLNP